LKGPFPTHFCVEITEISHLRQQTAACALRSAHAGGGGLSKTSTLAAARRTEVEVGVPGGCKERAVLPAPAAQAHCQGPRACLVWVMERREPAAGRQTAASCWNAEDRRIVVLLPKHAADQVQTLGVFDNVGRDFDYARGVLPATCCSRRASWMSRCCPAAWSHSCGPAGLSLLSLPFPPLALHIPFQQIAKTPEVLPGLVASMMERCAHSPAYCSCW
jgi:hypothetical protein